MITPHPVSTQGAPPPRPKVSDRYPLTSLQQGMLYHWLTAPQAGVDVEQVVCTLLEPVDTAKLRLSWDIIAARHSVLRARICLENVPEAEVVSECSLDWQEEDLRTMVTEQQDRKLHDFLRQDRKRGFELTTAPLWRLTLFRLGDADYRLVWTFHHAILDGRSFTTVLREVFTVFDREGTPEFPALPDFGDFALWRSRLDFSSAEEFWRNMLREITAPTPLPLKNLPDRASEPAQGDAELRLSHEVTRCLKTFADAHGLTLNTVLQGAWAVLLSRYSGERDVVFGATRACRHASVPGSAEMVGLLINTLPVRVDASPEMRLVPWLQDLRSLWLAMREHEHTPLTQIQAWSGIPGDQRLFDTLVVYENQELTTAVASTSPTGQERHFRLYEQTGLGLTLTAFGGEELLLRLEYNEAEFSKATAVRTLGHLQVLLEAFVANPERTLGELSILTPGEKAELTAGSNPPTHIPSSHATLNALFTAQAERTPDAVAVSFEGNTLTYAELDRRSNQLATHLQSLGVGPEIIVGLRLERTNTLIVALVAILKAGGAYLPIDLSYPPERVAFMLSDAQVSILLTESHLVSSLVTAPEHVVCMDQWTTSETAVPRSTAATPDSLAYVIYTSGSTGQPKGCMVTHRNVTRLFTATEEWFRFGADDVWTMFHSVAFDFSVWEIWGALLYGGRLVIVPYETSRSPEVFRGLLSAERVTVLNQTPSAFRQLITADQIHPGKDDLHLRYVIFGGEALEMQSLRPWFDRHGDKRPQLVNMYGITETTVHVTYRPISANDLGSASVIGVPIPDLQLYVLDPTMRPVPIGVPGEMYVGGTGVARGYLHRPELTEQRFLPDSFQPTAATKLYRTGDLARWLPGRDLEYLGRIDHQVKIRGFRIELGEIESALCLYPDISEAVVVPRENAIGDKRLVAYFVSRTPTPTTEQLRAYLKARLPEYMIPAAFVPLEKIPLTGNGKVDRKALPEPESVRSNAGSEYVAARTTTEEVLSQIWKEVLRVERVGIHDNFFGLGGDSILSILIVSRARQAGLQLSPRHIFKHHTVAELAAALSDSISTKQSEVPTGDVPWTPIQRWFWSHNFAEPNHWNQAWVFRSSERLAPEALRSALRAITRQHDVFRLRFRRSGSTWNQIIGNECYEIPCDYFDLSGDGDPLTSMACVASGMQAALNLEQGPLLRLCHFELGQELGVRLLVIGHHLLVDGVSWRIFMEDLELAYDQALAGKGPELPARTTPFAGWARVLPRLTHALDAERAYWKEEICSGGAPLPKDIEEGENDEASQAAIRVSLTPEETDRLLQELPAAFGTRINDVLLTALALSIAEWTGRSDLLIDLEGHGREEALVADRLGSSEAPMDLSRTMGWFTSIYPVALHASPSVRDTLLATRDKLRSLPNRGFGYGILRHLDDLDKAHELTSGAEILFNYLGQFEQTVGQSRRLQLFSDDIGPWHSPRGRRTHLLEINCLVIGRRLEARWQFSRNHHRPETITRIAERFAEVLRQMLNNANGLRQHTPSDFPLATLTPAALETLSAKHAPLEDIYPLAPLQHLYFTLELAQRGAGIDQWHCVLRGRLDEDRFHAAWNAAFQRHPILRSAFVVEDCSEAPLQVVQANAVAEWRSEDWRSRSSSEQEVLFSEFLRRDVLTPFDLSKPPLTRIALFQVGEQEWRFVWTHHHLQIDGWSWPRLLEEVSRHYAGEQIEPAPPYRRYVEWLNAVRETGGEQFWRQTLQGFTAPTRAPLSRALNCGKQTHEFKRNLPSETTAALHQLARTQRVTLNVVLQATLALVLARNTRFNDVVFGASFSGRPTDVAGMDRTIGPFVTNLPVRARLIKEQPIAELFKQLHAQLLASSEHQYTALPQIQAWSEVPWNARLFETLFVFQNYQINDAARRIGSDIRIEELNAPVRTNFPLTIVAVPGPELEVWAIAPDRYSEESVKSVAEQFTTLLTGLTAAADISVGDLLERLPVPEPVDTDFHLSSISYIAPQTLTERTIASVWREAFGREQVGIQDNFFDLGGHSLLMLQVHRRLSEILPQKISIARMFQHPTIQALARHIDEGSTPSSQPLASVQSRAAQQRAALARQRITPRGSK